MTIETILLTICYIIGVGIMIFCWKDLFEMQKEMMGGKTIIGKIIIGLPLCIFSIIVMPLLLFTMIVFIYPIKFIEEKASFGILGRKIKGIFYK